MSCKATLLLSAFAHCSSPIAKDLACGDIVWDILQVQKSAEWEFHAYLRMEFEPLHFSPLYSSLIGMESDSCPINK